MKSSAEYVAQQRFWDAWADDYQALVSIAVEDFHYGPLLPGERELHLLPELPPGATALEIGCGAAQNSLFLAARGVACTAIDVSGAQLSHAKRMADRLGLTLRCEQDAMETANFRALGTFDLLHSSHALQFTPHPFRVLKRAVRALRPGGILVLSTQHPLFSGEWLRLTGEGYGLFITSYFRPTPDERETTPGETLTSRAWPISHWFKALRAMGLNIEALLEPPALPPSRRAEAPYKGGEWEHIIPQLRRIPSTLIIRARRIA